MAAHDGRRIMDMWTLVAAPGCHWQESRLSGAFSVKKNICVSVDYSTVPPELTHVPVYVDHLNKCFQTISYAINESVFPH